MRYSNLEKAFSILALLLYSGGLIDTFLGAESSAIKQIIWFLIYGITLFLLTRRLKQTVGAVAKTQTILISCLLLLAVASCIWSSNAGVTLRRAVALLGSTSFGVYLASQYSYKEQIRLFAMTFGIAVILSFAFCIFLPSYGLMTHPHAGACQGIYSHKNALGRITSIAISVFVFYDPSRAMYKHAKFMAIFLSFALILLSTSKTPLVTVALIIIIFCVAPGLRVKDVVLIPLISLSTVFLFASGFMLFENLADILALLERDVTLSGRTLLWPLVFQEILERPLLGYGYGAFWISESSDIWTTLQWTAPHAHNGFLELMLDLGFLGLFVYIFSFLAAFWKTFRLFRQSRCIELIFPLVFLVFTFQANLNETLILRQNSIYWIIYITILFSDKRNLMSSFANDSLVAQRRQEVV